MDVLREREEKDNLERQLHEEQKIRGKRGTGRGPSRPDIIVGRTLFARILLFHRRHCFSEQIAKDIVAGIFFQKMALLFSMGGGN